MWPRQARLAGAGLLALAFFLPQFTCSAYRAPDGRVVAQPPPDSTGQRYERVDQAHYVWEDPQPSDVGWWLIVLAFAWPIPMLFLRRHALERRKWLSSVLEGALLVGSAYVIWDFSGLGRRALGAFVGLAGVVTYASAVATDTFSALRRALPVKGGGGQQA
jgi:hypothetical protein